MGTSVSPCLVPAAEAHGGGLEAQLEAGGAVEVFEGHDGEGAPAVAAAHAEPGHAAAAEPAAEQGLTLVHTSAQPEPFLTQNTPSTCPDTP
jgi:hypothetical protein